MKQKEFIEELASTFEIALTIAKNKNDDYAANEDPWRNFRFSEIAGIDVPHAILVRMLDKIARISNLINKDASVKDESVEDTLVDLINYAAILKVFLKHEHEDWS